MTEQQYIDLSDLQLFRAVLGILRDVTANEEPNKSTIEETRRNIYEMIRNLEPKVSAYLDEEEIK